MTLVALGTATQHVDVVPQRRIAVLVQPADQTGGVLLEIVGAPLDPFVQVDQVLLLILVWVELMTTNISVAKSAVLPSKMTQGTSTRVSASGSPK